MLQDLDFSYMVKPPATASFIAAHVQN